MIECIFTLDYEVRGDGSGSLRELVYEPAQRLVEIFRQAHAKFVPFVEVAELEIIDAAGTDPGIDLVKQQIRQFHAEGFNLGLHLHPQWYGARYENGQWLVDYSEYNLCTLPRERIEHIVDRAIAYFRRVLGEPDFTPLSFRAGNWLFQPTRTAASVLLERGVRIDSSVFKGGVRHEHNLDYRRALKNGYYWKFTEHADVAEQEGIMLEIPIFARQVPAWRISSAKRIAMERRHFSSGTLQRKLYRLRDAARLRHPLKFDFCRMTMDELTAMMDCVIEDDRRTPHAPKPIVAIGHTKELEDLDTIRAFLAYLRSKEIAISTFEDVYGKCSKRCDQPPLVDATDASTNGSSRMSSGL